MCLAVFSTWDLWTLDEKKTTFIYYHPWKFIYLSAERISERSIKINLSFLLNNNYVRLHSVPSPAGFCITCGAVGRECYWAEPCMPWATRAVYSIFSIFLTSEICVFLWKHNQVSELDGINCKSCVLFLPARFGNRVFLCAPACLSRVCQDLDESITLRYIFYSKPTVCCCEGSGGLYPVLVKKLRLTVLTVLWIRRMGFCSEIK